MDEKYYYTISEVEIRTGISKSTLRFWEQQFVQLKPKRSSKGTRRYTSEDIDLINSIKTLIDSGLTIYGAQQQLKCGNLEVFRNKQRLIAVLREVRAELVTIRKELNETEALAEQLVVLPDKKDSKIVE